MHLYHLTRSTHVADDRGFASYLLHHAEFGEDEFATLVTNCLAYALDKVKPQGDRLVFSMLREAVVDAMVERYGFLRLADIRPAATLAVSDSNLRDGFDGGAEGLRAVREKLRALGAVPARRQDLSAVDLWELMRNRFLAPPAPAGKSMPAMTMSSSFAGLKAHTIIEDELFDLDTSLRMAVLNAPTGQVSMGVVGGHPSRMTSPLPGQTAMARSALFEATSMALANAMAVPRHMLIANPGRGRRGR